MVTESEKTAESPVLKTVPLVVHEVSDPVKVSFSNRLVAPDRRWGAKQMRSDKMEVRVFMAPTGSTGHLRQVRRPKSTNEARKEQNLRKKRSNLPASAGFLSKSKPQLPRQGEIEGVTAFHPLPSLWAFERYGKA